MVTNTPQILWQKVYFTVNPKIFQLSKMNGEILCASHGNNIIKVMIIVTWIIKVGCIVEKT